MINVQAVVLKSLLSCEDKELALECFELIKPHFFSSAYATIYTAIGNYYNEHGKIPSLLELSIKFSRSANLQMAISALTQLDDLDIDLEMACDALRNEYAQQEALALINEMVLKDITGLTAEDIIDRLATIPTALEEKVDHSGKILTAKDITVFKQQDNNQLDLIYTGISNKWDNDFGGVGRQELILLGGGMGSGKSVTCANICAKQWLAGNIAPYYTIEMTGQETMWRILSILSGVDAMLLKQQRLEGDQLLKVALTRAKMFHGGAEAYKNFVRNKKELKCTDFYDLDRELMRNHEEIHPLIIVDDSDLRLSSIDVSLSKFKSKYGDKLTMGIVDYINEVRLQSAEDPYSWTYQLELARGLKRLARKHDCAIISPYQMNDDGSARFSKTLLVPVDIALNLRGDQDAGLINFSAAKVRSLPPCEFNVGMNWNCLQIDPEEVTKEEAEQVREQVKNNKDKGDPEFELD